MGKRSTTYASGLPEAFLNRTQELFGSLFPVVRGAFVERPTTFRFNTLKVAKEHTALRRDILADLKKNGIHTAAVPWYTDAYVVTQGNKRALTDSVAYTSGQIYIQSLASMVPPLILLPEAGKKVLDLTAAPGSKTSQIAALMGGQGELVANENNKVRFFKLQHNMQLLGVLDARDAWTCTLRMEDGRFIAKEFPEYFDRVLLDAPCSAEARFVEGERETYGYWKEAKIKEMAYKQWGLLLAAWSMLKPGGTLVYSTCTFAPEENELQITKFLERVGDEAEIISARVDGLKALPLSGEWKGKHIDKAVQKHALRILPTKDIEGFFVAAIRKKA
jgi:tRNA (cytosine49-C5)-methyltransferase